MFKLGLFFLFLSEGSNLHLYYHLECQEVDVLTIYPLSISTHLVTTQTILNALPIAACDVQVFQLAQGS